MEKSPLQFDDPFVQFAMLDCERIVVLNLEEDSYETLHTGYGKSQMREGRLSSGSTSEWFKWFSSSLLCHPEDAQKLSLFHDPEKLKLHLDESGRKPFSISCRRRNDSSSDWLETLLAVIPDPNNALKAYLFLRKKDGAFNSSQIAINTTAVYAQEKAANLILADEQKRTILIVDDNLFDLELMKSIFSDEYRVLIAENGEQAYSLMQSVSLSAVLLDLNMPVTDGRAFLRKVKGDLSLADVPILVVTCEDSSEIELECLELGASDFITKPIESAIALKRLESIIRLRESNTALRLIGINAETGLLTRNAFSQIANSILRKRWDEGLSIVSAQILDFDVLCATNESAYVSRVLKTVGEQVSSDETCLACSYLGEGRFAALCLNKSRSDYQEFVRRFTMDRRHHAEYSLQVNLGVVERLSEDSDISVALRQSSDAVKEVMHDKKQFVGYYTDEHERQTTRYRILAATALECIENGSFYPVYQPKHDSNTGRLIGCEVLSRLKHPLLGQVSPAEFIELFEQKGYITELDAFIRSNVIADMNRWKSEGLPIVPMSMNLSKRELEDAQCLADIFSYIERDDSFSPSLLHAEVTETMWSDDLDSVLENMHKLKQAGLKLELDDFGSGYSSLSMMAQFPFDVIKLDMSLVRNIDVQEPVIESASELAHKLGMEVIAEGVEDMDSIERLAALGVDAIQGYCYSTPLLASEFAQYLKDCG